MTRIKICGNTELDGVRLAVRLGADLLGFIFTRSPRRVSVEQANALLEEVPPTTGRVGVFIDEDPGEIASVLKACPLTAIQLYRTPTPADRALGVPLFPALRLEAGGELPRLALAQGDHPLLDTWQPDAIGGTGKTWDWTLAESLARRYPVVVSGGLRPENVGAAIRQLRPWGVDVCSGVERKPGVKDLGRLEWFIRTVRQADAGVSAAAG